MTVSLGRCSNWKVQTNKKQLIAFSCQSQSVCGSSLFHKKKQENSTTEKVSAQEREHFQNKTTDCPSGWNVAGLLLLSAQPPAVRYIPRSSYPVTDSEPFLKCLPSVGKNSCRNSPASVSGEWQVTACVTNESSVQLHLFNAPLWRANRSRLFVKLFATPQERRERGN